MTFNLEIVHLKGKFILANASELILLRTQNASFTRKTICFMLENLNFKKNG